MILLSTKLRGGMPDRLQPAVRALIEIVLLFLPALPAYLWLWPNVDGTPWSTPVQVAVYLYFLAGCLLIGMRRWSPSQLGLNRQGIGLSLACGVIILAAIILGRLATNLPSEIQPFNAGLLAVDVLFYFGLVGLIEELLFRGVIYQALDQWRGARWAIWGSSLAFGLYHIGRVGLTGAAGLGFIGLILGVIRWRAGGIVGLILVHGAIDVLSSNIFTALTPEQAFQFRMVRPAFALLSDALLFSLLIYLWKIHPVVLRRLGPEAGDFESK